MVEVRRLQAARSMVAAKDSEACGVAAGGGKEGALAVALGSQQGPEQECTLGHAMGSGGGGADFEFCSKRNEEHFLTKQVKLAYLFVLVQGLFLPSRPCHSHSGKLMAEA